MFRKIFHFWKNSIELLNFQRFLESLLVLKHEPSEEYHFLQELFHLGVAGDVPFFHPFVALRFGISLIFNSFKALRVVAPQTQATGIDHEILYITEQTYGFPLKIKVNNTIRSAYYFGIIFFQLILKLIWLGSVIDNSLLTRDNLPNKILKS